MTSWEHVNVMNSSDTCVKKLVFTKEDAVAEAVLYGYPDHRTRTVICCSTQSGCPVGCTFCGTGKQFVRSLTAEEIVSQVTTALSYAAAPAGQIEKLQVMFMSMGEPMLNYKNLVRAITSLAIRYPHADLLISTSAPRVSYEHLYAVSKFFPRIGLQFSIHESTDSARNKLIPFKKKLTLLEISVVGERWAEATGRRPFFNYCAHEGNTSDKDIARLKAIFVPEVWEATISVICEKDETVAKAQERQTDLVEDFTRRMLESGYSVRMFNPAGQDDIGGGCGQLWYTQDWIKNHKDKGKN